MDPVLKFLILGKNGLPVRKQQFEATQQLWIETFAEARHRLNVLVQQKVIRRADASIVKLEDDGVRPVYWSDEV